MSFLSGFKKVLDAITTAESVAEPIVSQFDPEVGLLMKGATHAVVLAEAAITGPNAGPQRAQAVQQSVQASFDAANAIRQSQGKAPLPPQTVSTVMQTADMVVQSLNGVQKLVEAGQPAAPPAQ